MLFGPWIIKSYFYTSVVGFTFLIFPSREPVLSKHFMIPRSLYYFSCCSNSRSSSLLLYWAFATFFRINVGVTGLFLDPFRLPRRILERIVSPLLSRRQISVSLLFVSLTLSTDRTLLSYGSGCYASINRSLLRAFSVSLLNSPYFCRE